MTTGASLRLQARTVAVETTTVRQFLRAAGVAVAVLGGGCLLYAVEKYGLNLPHRVVKNPADVMMRVLAMAHFAVGWLYLATSPRLHNRRALGRLAVATCLGGALCGFFAFFGGTRQPLLAMVFYGYFLAHELGDEVMFYQAYGDHVTHSPAEAQFLKSVARSAALLFLLVLAGCYFGCAWMENDRLLRRMPAGAAPLALAGLAAGAFTLCAGTLRRGIALFGSLRHMFAAHAPLFVVYGWLLGVLAVGSLLGTTGLNTIILIHVAVWIVFTYHQLAKRSNSRQSSIWSWLRTTPAGFLTLHIGVAAGFLGLMALSVYFTDGRGWLGAAVAGKNFCYWGLMHISMSLWNAR